MTNNNIRVHTKLNGEDSNVKVQLNQNFDFLEILSLKISQEDVYRSFYSDYGVVVGRVIMNSGVGVPNARVSVFIPLSEEDVDDSNITSIYPYSDLSDLDSNGIRYNTLPNDAQGKCHAPVGTFPTKRELIDNNPLFEVFEKYYKYTTTTNGSGDFMLFGVPVGNHILNIDVDLSDIGIFSQRPYDFIEQGNPNKLFDSPTKFKSGNNLNNLTQLKNRQVGINVIPFWGEELSNEIGISRIDVDVNYNIKPQAIFMGSIFGDNEKNSVNKNCRPRKKLGQICETSEGEGTIEMIRKNILGGTERLDIEGGQLINNNGVWAYQVPMNLDYMVTDEFGVLVESDDPNKGIPTRAKMRFKISMNETGGNGRLRTKAKYLVPHNPSNVSEVDYSFDESTANEHFKDFYWNKIYTIKNHITKFQKGGNRNFIGLKDVDECVGVKNPPPFNKIGTKFSVLYTLFCFIMTIILFIVTAINKIISLQILNFWPIKGVRPFCTIRCISLKCPANDENFEPGCDHGCGEDGVNESSRDTQTCLQVSLAEALNVFEFDFYNEWLNGALYSFLLKYKFKKKGEEKYCGDGDDNRTYITNSNIPNVPPNQPTLNYESVSIDDGVIDKFKDELFYKVISKNGYKLFSTDIYELGAVFNCDWQGIPKIQKSLIGTSYQIPPLLDDDYDDNDDNTGISGLIPLLFDLSCTDVKNINFKNIRHICEIGVGLDEDENQNRAIDNNDIIDVLLRSQLILLNTLNSKQVDMIDSNFTGAEYNEYRGLKKLGGITTYDNSFYFYFGTKPNNTALDLMNNKYFTDCSKTIKSLITITGVIKNVSTVGGSDGEINITIRGGSPDYIYNWYKSDDPNTIIGSNEDITNLESGTYHVVVTDGNDYSVKKTFIVRGLQPLIAEIGGKNTKSLNESSGIIYVKSITGGIGPYDVIITGPKSETFNDVPYSINFEDLPKGSYHVKITDSNSPTDVWGGDITIGVPDILDVTSTSQNPNCFDFDDGIISVIISGGTPPYNLIFTNLSNANIIEDYLGAAGNIDYDSLNYGLYKFEVVDDYGQSYNSPSITLTEGKEPKLTRKNMPFRLKCYFLIYGQKYFLEKNGNRDGQISFIANGTTKEFITGPTSNNTNYQLVSEYGCSSNVIS